MLKKIKQVPKKIAIPFNLIALVVVTISGWFTYQKTGFSYYVWIPVAVAGFGLALGIWSKRHVLDKNITPECVEKLKQVGDIEIHDATKDRFN